ncbi:SLATT domain-containing protein [Bacillus sp. SH5-2]|uniref:SLATT domain-containing protein n=1 Tax=Bacillus sp. SH5-2 TaxID=2217834 RepID=UPI0011EC9A4B|nr:SLATT domain-containing protein [Bacillus sp. SH5-2]KAA0762987.1 SLATT domain-containing protein [Bacillus sp. SH5-2]
MSTEQKVNEQVLHIQQKDKTVNNMDVFNELKRRVDLTRRARIKASARLREKHEFFERTSYFYSVVVLILSIWFIDGKGDIPKVLLISSLSLTFFTMFLGVKSYKERASNFENNYQQLNVLLNKLQRLEADPNSINQLKLKELHREYEKLILEKENHISIDYMTCKPDHEEKYKDEIRRYVWQERFQRFIVFCLPLILLILFIKK